MKKKELAPKTCEICGKQFNPIKCTQKCCSKPCTDVNRLRLIASWRKKPAEEKNLCKICGKPVEHVVYGDYKFLPQMHDDCVIDDALNSLKNNEILNHIQLQRLYARGYDVAEARSLIRS